MIHDDLMWTMRNIELSKIYIHILLRYMFAPLRELGFFGNLGALGVLQYWLTLEPLNYSIGIFTHLKLCLADAIHNFK